MRELASYWEGQFDDFSLELDRVIDLDDGRALALLYQRGRIHDSADPVEGEIGYLGVVEDDLLKLIDVVFSWADARDAAGLGG